MSNSIAGVITWPPFSISMRATVLRDTFKRSANAACVSPIRLRIALNSSGVMYRNVAMHDYVVNYKSPLLIKYFAFAYFDCGDL